jgi:hypothetical protein
METRGSTRNPVVTMATLLATALTRMSETPSLLEQRPTEKMKELDDSLKSDGQGSANKCSAHEACVALVLESVGFKRSENTVEDGFYYQYQQTGSQRSGDFGVFSVTAGVRSPTILLDAKHSNGMSIYLNDGTFETDTVYIVSFTRVLEKVSGQRKKPRQHACFIGRGQDVMTERDRSRLDKWRTMLRTMNEEEKQTEKDFLRLYSRSANQYSCQQFVPEFTASCLAKTLSWLLPSVE